MAGTAVVLQLISIFFCCGRCLVESDSEPERFTLATQISGACDRSKLIVDSFEQSCTRTRASYKMYYNVDVDVQHLFVTT